MTKQTAKHIPSPADTRERNGKPIAERMTKPATKPATPTAKQSSAKPIPTTRKKPLTARELDAQHNRQHNAAKIAWLTIYSDRMKAIPATSKENKAKRTVLAEKLKALQTEIKRDKIVSLAS